MLFKVFCIYDSAVKAWDTPIYARSLGEMMRSFTDACNDPKCKLNKHSADYTLFDLGTFDDSNGQLSLHKTPVSLCIAQEQVKPVMGNQGSGGGAPQLSGA